MAPLHPFAVACMSLSLCFEQNRPLMETEAFHSSVVTFRRPKRTPARNPISRRTMLLLSSKNSYGDEEDGNNDTREGGSDWISSNAELITDDFYDDDLDEWMPDREKARRAREARTARRPEGVYYDEPKSKGQPKEENPVEERPSEAAAKSKAYTQEEEELIAAMGGKEGSTRKREAGFLGDSTLKEIAMDYSVPVCYLADVLCMWGVPVPIDTNDRLGDLATGEQAFAIVEAIYSLDVSALHDRYSNQSLMSVCDDYEIDLREGFEMAVREGWSLPFGVQTCLRVDQEEELLRVLGTVV